MVAARWSVEQVVAVAPSPSSFAAAQPLADPTRWSGTGADDRAVWGRCRGSGREPYETMVDHVGLGWRCSCPSRRSPCKHALALVLLWVRGDVADSARPSTVERWISRRPSGTAAHGAVAPAPTAPASGGHDEHDEHDDRASGRPGDEAGERLGDRAGEGAGEVPGDRDGSDRASADPDGSEPDGRPDGAPGDRDLDRDAGRDERVARMRAGLVELDRWLDDRLRTGLSDPSLARYATWDELAARLVDARAGALANRVRRLAGLVGASPDWHERVLAELGVLHLLARAGLRLPELPGDLADAVATTTGWQVRQADVLAGVPETDDWVVAGRSDTREDRIEVRRTWLWGRSTGRWAMVLSFAAYRQSLDAGLEVGTAVRADLFRYPGGALRALVGDRSGLPERAAVPATSDIASACDAVGRAVAREPWLERSAVSVRATPTVVDGRWVLTDDTGSLPLLGDQGGLASLLAASIGAPVDLTVEWTPHGVVPLTIHLADRAVDIGPRADPSFVAAS